MSVYQYGIERRRRGEGKGREGMEGRGREGKGREGREGREAQSRDLASPLSAGVYLLSFTFYLVIFYFLFFAPISCTFCPTSPLQCR